MSAYRIGFFVENARELDPQLGFAGSTLGKLEVTGEARAALSEHLSPRSPDELTVNGYIPVVLVDVEADDEEQAMISAFHRARLVLEPHSLVAIEAEGFDFWRRRPRVLPNALLVDDQQDKPTIVFRYQDGPHLLRLNVGPDSVGRVQAFNRDVVRRIAQLYPSSLVRGDSERSTFDSRIASAVHWFSEAEGQSDPTMAFVCYWIGLEALVLKSSSSSNKKRTLVSRLSPLAALHGPSVGSEARLEELWDKRSDVVHEGYGAAPAGILPEVDATDLNDVKYFFFIALLYAVEQNTAGVPFEALWHPRNRDPYSPGAVILRSGFPILIQSLKLSRRTC